MTETLPEDATVVGTVHITQYIDENGEFKTAYDIDGMADEAALGFMVTVSDRIREETKYKWDTCPACEEDWESHGSQEDYDEEDDD